MARYRTKHGDKIRARRTAARARDPEGARRGEAAWRAANKAKDRAAKRAWAAANADKMRAIRAKNRAIERARSLARLYGISKDDYEAMRLAQRGVCAVCLGPPGRKSLSVDHDHATGAVRGLLCSACNLALGSLRDDPRRIASLLEYIVKAKGRRPDASPVASLG